MLEPLGPVLHVRRTYHRAYFTDLVHLAVALEKGFPDVHLSHKTTESEDIDRSRVGRKPKEQFWSSVPASGDVLGEGRNTAYFLCNSKIDYFETEVLGYKDIFGLQVAMEESLFVSTS